MNKPPSKTSAKSEPKKASATEVIDDNDFSGSMARLAELAAAGLASEKVEKEKKDLEQEALNQFLTPKRKKKGASESSETPGSPGTIKFRVNPYVVSGLLVVSLSLGVLAIPKIVHFMYAEPPKDEQSESAKQAAQQSAKQDGKMQSYTVANAIQDVTRRGELKTSSVADLAQQVAETNTELGLSNERSRYFSFLTEESETHESMTEEAVTDTREITPEETDLPTVSTAEWPSTQSLNTEVAPLPEFSLTRTMCSSAHEIVDDPSNIRFFWALVNTQKIRNSCGSW